MALASGIRFFGDQDWFRTGAHFILENQVVPGSAQSAGVIDNDPIGRAFALMFLARGRAPTWITKIALPGQRWNNRPNEIDRLTSHLSDLREVELNWQTLSLDAPADELLTSPLAYLTSDQAIELSPDQLEHLKYYLDRGGLLVACPNDDSPRFNRSIRKLARTLYPRWPLKPLDTDHLLFRDLYRVPRGGGKPVQSVSNGARDLIILTARDWGRGFQSDRVPGRSRSWKLAINLFSIVTERGRLRPRLIPPFEPRGPGPSTGRVVVGRALAGSDTNLVEPALWAVFSDHLFNRTGIELETRNIALDRIGESDLPLIHFSGVDPIELSAAEFEAIRMYAERGGTLLVENVGGRGGFAASIEEQLDAHFDASAAALRHKSPLISGESLEGGYDNRRLRYRRHTVAMMGVSPVNRLAAFRISGRPAVIVSHEDLSLGALGVRRWGIHGYEPQSARQLLTNFVLWAKGGGGKREEGGEKREERREGDPGAPR